MNRNFSIVADEFEARVQKAELTGTTDVTLVCHCVDGQGNELLPVRQSLVPLTTVRGFGSKGPAFTAASHRASILESINSLVRYAPEGLIMLRDGPQVPVRIVSFELEIEDLAS